MLKKLQLKTDNDGNKIYKFTNPSRFNDNNNGEIQYEYTKASFEFAHAMSFTGEGHHRSTRSGGSTIRNKVNVFCDTLLGKLGEFAVYQYFRQHDLDIDYPDLNIMGEGLWDSYDFVYKGRKIGVKTTKSFGNLLLLETKDWNQDAQYIPNINSGDADYDDMLFVRVTSDIIEKLKQRMLSGEIGINILQEEFRDCNYKFDIFHVPISLVRLAIENQLIINKGDLLQTVYTKMDAPNYYIQSGDMRNISSYINELKLI